SLWIFSACAVNNHDSEIAEPRDEDSGQVPAGRASRQPVEEPDPALAGTRAVLMITAHHNPGRRGEQGSCRLKKICVPRIKSVAPRAGGAAGVLWRTRQFAIMVVADVDHQVRPRFRGGGSDFRKWPRRRIVAVLLRIAVKPTAGVAENHNPLGVWPCER